ncbi:hypothetical protein [Paenibacillus bovis]|uniref:Uncharacterized protein n=1 Tax=Paenibacillus bovis TaxID=1616788 RepID=A0A172ZI01_9BACL|nr:hypothetical protein [Paenibacillus bovis]ANF97163.1 hypothetical protein AR543_14915 [Paenibacillus bovis]
MNTFQAKRPSGSRDFIGILLNLVLLVCILGNLTFPEYRLSWYYMVWTMLILLIVYLAVMVRRRLQKPFSVQLDKEAIRVGDRKIGSNGIQQIWLKGYERPVVGIQSHGRRILTPSHCFVFVGEEDLSLEQLSEWASQHGIQVVNKPFMRWI